MQRSLLEIAELAGCKAGGFSNTTLYYFNPDGEDGWNIGKIILENGEIKNIDVCG